MNNSTSLFDKHQETLTNAISALSNRTYYTPYPENPKTYAEDGDAKAKAYISSVMNSNFRELLQGNGDGWVGEEVSPYLQMGIGTKYPIFTANTLIEKANNAQIQWAKTSVQSKAGILLEALDRVKARFFDIAQATMHSTGQSFMMSFQASGPHSNDRALEALAIGYKELTSAANEATWVKSMGKFDLTIKKNWKAMPKGIGLVIGCSTFPVWNTVPGLYANLITGNSTIVKPHPKAILPIAIFIAELQQVLQENNIDPCVVQLAVDVIDKPITKLLAEHVDVKLIDYTGGSEFGNYIEQLNKTVFTEKAGVNSIIIDSATDLKPVFGNIAFSACLYSGQMCTAPQNIFIPASGVATANGVVNFDDAVNQLCTAISDLVNNPKAGAPTLGSIQSDLTYNRAKNAATLGGKVVLEGKAIVNEEFADARIITPAVIVVDELEYETYNKECFGPIVFVIKTQSTEASIKLAKKLAAEKGAITCGAYSTNNNVMANIEDEMNAVFTPVSFNFMGAAFINSHAAFSDYHVSGGNPSGNASLVTTEYLVKRFVWVGNRYA